MYSNWGPAIQIKHLCLDVELAEAIVTNISSDRIVIVCKEAEKGVIVSLLTQIGWKSRIQNIITRTIWKYGTKKLLGASIPNRLVIFF
ncbi:MAG: HaeII family restriction endonuclease [Bacteroidales bacterium]|nr:HaeII family restriction endonuclease [Bacteroidales bacterium]